MLGNIISAAVGVLCVVIGISHCRGNLSLLHSYHIERVSQENRLPLGKRVGLGAIITGASIIAQSVLATVSIITQEKIYSVIGNAVLAAGLFVGIAIMLLSINKYNKGIF